MLDTVTSTATISLEVFNLQGFATSAGVYGPALPSETGLLMFPFSGIAFPASQTSLALSGVFSLTSTERQILLDREFYFSVQSTAFPSGEVFGYPVLISALESPRVAFALVPEPASGMLAATALAGVLALGRLRGWRDIP